MNSERSQFSGTKEMVQQAGILPGMQADLGPSSQLQMIPENTVKDKP